MRGDRGLASEVLGRLSMESRFDSPAQRLTILATAAAALLAALASSPPSCPMSVTGGERSLVATGMASYERHFTLDSSAPAVGVVSVFLQSSSVARVLLQVIPDGVPEGEAAVMLEPVALELAPGVRHEVEFPSFVDGVRVRAELESGDEVALDVAVSAAQDDCHDNAFVKVVDG
jgi:hypothetical protein